MAEPLSDEWLVSDLALWQGDTPVEVTPAYLRQLIREIQKQRKEIENLKARIDAFERHCGPKRR